LVLAHYFPEPVGLGFTFGNTFGSQGLEFRKLPGFTGNCGRNATLLGQNLSFLDRVLPTWFPIKGRGLIGLPEKDWGLLFRIFIRIFHPGTLFSKPRKVYEDFY